MKFRLKHELLNHYIENEEKIKNRLDDFKNVSAERYFYELAYCICTPQSKAVNAGKVQKILEDSHYLENPFDVTDILRNKENYIRFHNQKAQRIFNTAQNFSDIESILTNDWTSRDKRDWFVNNLNGFGMKESSHFLRNIGHRNLAILDRHIFAILIDHEVIDELPKSINVKKYLEIESKFIDFSNDVSIPLDELDLLFWSYKTGEILK